MKQTPRQLRLDPDVSDEVKKIADKTGLPQIEVIRQMVRAGVLAIKANAYKLPLPLHLEVSDSEPVATSTQRGGIELNEKGDRKK